MADKNFEPEDRQEAGNLLHLLEDSRPRLLVDILCHLLAWGNLEVEKDNQNSETVTDDSNNYWQLEDLLDNLRLLLVVEDELEERFEIGQRREDRNQSKSLLRQAARSDLTVTQTTRLDTEDIPENMLI